MPKSSSQLGPALIDASRKGDLKQVRELIAEGADVTYEPPAGTPLHNAVRGGHCEVVAELIKAGADVNHMSLFESELTHAVKAGRANVVELLIASGATLTGGKFGASPLLHAVTDNKLDMVKLLIKAGADLNEKGSVVCGGFGKEEVRQEGMMRITHVPNPPVARESTALIVAARRGYIEMTRLLIAEGADVNLSDKDGFTALVWAERSGNDTLVCMLRDAGARASEFPEGTPALALIQAAKNGDCNRLKELFGRKLDVNVKHGTDEEAERTPLICAAENAHEEAVCVLIEAGADVNLECGSGWDEDRGKTALMYAAQSGTVGILKLLLKKKAKLNAKTRGDDGKTALHYAATGGQAEAIEALVEAGLKVDLKTRSGATALSLAAGGGHVDAVIKLLELGADPNYVSKDGFTALFHAASEGHAEAVKALLDCGANPDPDVDAFCKPLEAASTGGHKKVVDLLLKAGTGAKSKTVRKSDAIVSAAMMGGPEMVKALLEADADPNQSDKDGFTALMGGVRAGNHETVKLLLDAGADINAANCNGETALDLAYDNIEAVKGQAKFLKLLCGAKLNAKDKEVIGALEQAGESDEMVELLQTRGAKRARDLGIKAPVAEMEADLADREAPELPDFSERAEAAPFKAAIMELEALCGAKPRPLNPEVEEESGNFDGCVGFQLPSEKAVTILREHHAAFLKRGYHLVRYERGLGGGKDRITLLPTADRREVLLAWQTNGANCDIMPDDVVKWLDDLMKEQPFELTGVGMDWCEGRFTEPIKNSRRLAKRMYEFCPDIVAQGVGTVAALAKKLTKTQQFFLWWD